MNLDENAILSKATRDLYDYNLTRYRVKKEVMSKYEQAKYQYRDIPQPQLTSNYEFHYEKRVIRKSDPTSISAEILIDTAEEVDDFYNKLTELTKEFTKEESLYYTNSLLRGKSEEEIQVILHLSKNGVKPIKESCIYKIALTFNKAVEKKK